MSCTEVKIILFIESLVVINLTNHFLVAMPSVNDAVFMDSVVYITEHNSLNGAVGVIVNKPLDQTLKNAFQDIDIDSYYKGWSKHSLYLGGPVNNRHGFVLHRTFNNNGKLFDLTNNRDVLTEIAASKFKEELFISVGYVSWNALQIEDEIKHNDWLVVKVEPDLIFAEDAANRYTTAMRLLGINNISHLYCSGAVIA